MNPVAKEQLADRVSEALVDTTPAVYQEVLHIAALRRRYRPPHVGLQNVFDQLLHTGFAALVFCPCFFGRHIGLRRSAAFCSAASAKWNNTKTSTSCCSCCATACRTQCSSLSAR